MRGWQVIAGYLVGHLARVEDGVVMAVRVRTVDEQLRVAEGALLGQR
jgi:hypothetical protein